MSYERGVVVKGPDLFADYSFRPYLCLSDETHPFSDEEALYAAITTTRRAVAIPLAEDDFVSGVYLVIAMLIPGQSSQFVTPI